MVSVNTENNRCLGWEYLKTRSTHICGSVAKARGLALLLAGKVLLADTVLGTYSISRSAQMILRLFRGILAYSSVSWKFPRVPYPHTTHVAHFDFLIGCPELPEIKRCDSYKR